MDIDQILRRRTTYAVDPLNEKPFHQEYNTGENTVGLDKHCHWLVSSCCGDDLVRALWIDTTRKFDVTSKIVPIILRVITVCVVIVRTITIISGY